MNETRRHQQMILLGFLSAALPWERDGMEGKEDAESDRPDSGLFREKGG